MTGFTSYTANYYIWHVMDKHIVQFVKPKRDDERIFIDEEHMPADEEDEDYPSYNGDEF